MQTQARIASRILIIFLVIAVAAALRLRAVQLLPVDYDEDDYLRAGQQYADGLRQGDWGVFTRENYRSEHPPLSKIVYGAALLAVPPFPAIADLPVDAPPSKSLPEAPLLAARTASAAFGILEVLVLAIINPLGGLFLAVHSFTIKYTSQVMLEGLPALTSLLVVVFFLLYHRNNRRGWLVLSAVAFGLTAAAKYYYSITAVAVAIYWLHERAAQKEYRTFRDRLHWLAPVAAWAGLALLVFFLANPYLWPDPPGRLWRSLTYHAGYAQSDAVRGASLPFWQPLNWLSQSVPWHPEVILVGLDILITFFALLGLARARQRHPLFLLWLGLALAFLLVWPTKWPQYILMLTAPLSIVAADGFQARIKEPLASWFSGIRSPKEKVTPRGHAAFHHFSQVIPWLLPGLLALALITLFPLIFQLAISMTDFSARAIKDGVTGGVWREVWLGLTGQVKPVHFDLFNGSTATKVHYAGLSALLTALFGAGNLYVFEIVWTVLAVASQAALGVGVAMLLHRQGVRFKGFWQAIFILPWAVPEFVAALSWSQIFEPRFGFLTLATKTWSQQAPMVAQTVMGWQSSPDLSLLVLLVAGLWYGFPFMLLSARAGLKLVPVEVYDAAAIDGASGWKLFRSVTWPLLFPLLLPAIILRAIFSFNQFYLFSVMRTPVTTLSALSYTVFNRGLYATSAVINVVTVIILIGLVIWFNRLTRAGEGVTYA